MRLVCAIVLVVGLALPAQAQDNNQRGWSFSGRFNGSSNSDGVVTKAETAVGYSFNNHVSTYVGVPFYFVNLSSTAAAAATNGTGGWMSGVGNAFLGFRAGVKGEVVNYTSNLEFTAPTGDKSRGFSTGRVTADWTNTFSGKVSALTPFGSVGIANTVSDTAFFVRPFTSLGVVGHFEGGATYDVLRAARIGLSAYSVRGTGEQRIISKVVRSQTTTATGTSGSPQTSNGNRVFEKQRETVSQAGIVNDHGFSTWFGVSPRPEVDFHAGYSRSVNYDFNTFFFGVGFHVGK
jgi:hypothetical protein